MRTVVRWRSRAQGAEPRQHWRSGQKKSQPIRVGISNIGGAASLTFAAGSYAVKGFGNFNYLIYPHPYPQTIPFKRMHMWIS